MVATLGVVLIGFGAAIGTAVSITGYYDELDAEHPAEFQALEGLTAPLATLATVVAGKPEIARVASGPIPIEQSAQYSTWTDSGVSAWLTTSRVTVTIVSPGNRHVSLTTALASQPGTPPVRKVVILVTGTHNPLRVLSTGETLRIPLELHAGLNRFYLSLVRRSPPSIEPVLLENFQLSG